MGSSQTTRLIVFSAFLVTLIVFAVLYRPVDAFSRPAPQNPVVQGE
jgi:hypothetical protein